MYIKSKGASIWFKVLIVIIGVVSILINAGVFSGRHNWGTFRYFTTLSNLLCIIYFVGAVKWKLNYRRSFREITWCPAFKGVVMMCITITMIVAHFVLGMGFDMGSQEGLSMLGLHYAVPLMTIVDWLLFDEKGLMKNYYPLVWIIAPYAYLGWALIAAKVGSGLGNGNSPYPYPFIDVDLLGPGRVALNVLVLTGVFLVLGYVYYFIDRKMGRGRRPKRIWS